MELADRREELRIGVQGRGVVGQTDLEPARARGGARRECGQDGEDSGEEGAPRQ